MEANTQMKLAVTLFLFSVVHSITDPNDLALLNQFKKGLENAELLNWPVNGNDPCGPPSWPHIFCSGNRVTQIQVRGLGLKGPLPQNFNQLSKLQNLGLQLNQFSGKLPSFNGLSELRYAYLDKNNFDTIPSDFFKGLVNLEVLALDNNPFNATKGWSLPIDLKDSAQLRNLTLINCSLSGSLPEFLGKMSSLEVLKLSFNRLTGVIPESFTGSLLTILWLNGQSEGKIPDKIGDLVSLQDLNLNSNDLVGLIPSSLANLVLGHLDLNNNHFMGPIPKFKSVNATYESNPFCVPKPGTLCDSNVMALLEFLDGINYPTKLVGSWIGNNPCQESWLGIGCDVNGNIITINLPNYKLSGTLRPSIADLDSLTHIFLQSNNLSGPIPNNWTKLKSLSLLDLSENNISLPIPRFSTNVKLILDGNSLLNPNFSGGSQSQNSRSSPIPSSSSSSSSSSTTIGSNSNSTSPTYKSIGVKRSNNSKLFVILAPVASFAILVCLVVPILIYVCNKRKDRHCPPSSIVIHPRQPSSNSYNAVKIAIANGTNRSASGSVNSNESRVIEAGNLVISVQVLRNVTNNFAPENELGRGGFGVVYKGELDDGTKIARRLNIALDVARGLEYLHTLAHQSFIHRDLKPSNILLGDDFRAKVSDFGLVKLAPDGETSVVTRLAGTFGYLAPEYAVTGKITTKADVFSFGVVLMELLTGMMALDEERPEESQYLVSWFWQIKSTQEKLFAAIDPALDIKEETFESISIISELAGHCTTRELGQRPDMGHTVNVLASLVEKWNPVDDKTEEYCGIDYSLPLDQMVKDWQEAEGKDLSYVDLEDSRDSIPTKPAGFADSFTSADGR
ncbi:hypothetical protein ACJIZ3_023950 [Penstemon smallii]|uniref:Protein kinase domain-containing protein n=1 Tax=Penstemon smallii TaxID=265156 RepID=A0ABD3TQH1_9LAMI